MNCDQSEVGVRREGRQDRILGVLTSLLIQMKFVGMKPPLSSAQSRAERQMEVIALAHWIDSARFFAAPRPTMRTKITTVAESRMSRELRPIDFTILNLHLGKACVQKDSRCEFATVRNQLSLGRRTTTSTVALFFTIMCAGRMPRQFVQG